MNSDNLVGIYGKIDSYREDMIDLQRELVAIPALGPDNDGEGEMEKALFLQKWMQDQVGFDSVERYDSPDDRVPGGKRPNIAARIKGRDSNRTIWVMAHMDVVPAGDRNQWDTDPFKLAVTEDKIIGRGVEDNHHGIVTPLFALKAIRELGLNLPVDVGIAAVSDEETSSRHGIEYLLENHDIFGRDDYIIVPDSGDPDGRTIEVAEKSIMWLEFTVKGKSCHASEPGKGINAHRAASYLVTRLDNRLPEKYSQRDELFDPPENTFEPTKRNENVRNVNTIPGEDIFCFDMRILPGISLDEVKKTVGETCSEIEDEFGVSISTRTAQIDEAAPATSPDAPVVKALAASIRDVRGIEPEIIGIGGGTVAAFFRRHGYDAVVWSSIADVCHQPNEYQFIDNMTSDAKVFANLFING
ncbi:MAG: M20 family metallo-hydrolase [Candidatus Latescibacteria bacterium]|nr:M20 family metallo-hydrolase [bacterium]MBD3425437.1 M20 family metallo-hydrolase [Candidatus Latescibacterota bacterium]